VRPERAAGEEAARPCPGGWSDAVDPEKPVTGVDWFDAVAYAQWTGGKLPGEVEWEKAAGWNPATAEKRVYPWGDQYAVGTGGPSACGAEAMGDGVLEWTADWYKAYPGGRPPPWSSARSAAWPGVEPISRRRRPRTPR